jgi:uncharacterized membrane protein YecN with MAPEG domain
MSSTFPVVTALVAGILGLLGALLTVNVIMNRARHKVDAGDGGVAQLAQSIRAQANFVEQAPLALILIGLGEVAGVRMLVAQILAAVLVAARLASAVALSRSLGQSQLRQFGGGFSVLLTLAASAALLLALAGIR